MRAVANLRRGDFLKMHLYLLPRMKSNWVVLAIIWGLVVSEVIKTDIPKGLSMVLLCLACSLIGAFLITLSLFFTVVFLTMLSPQIGGVIGRHEFEITEKGFLERNENAETVSFWHSIKSIKLAGPYIYVRTSALLFAIVPRHGFRVPERICQLLSSTHSKLAQIGIAQGNEGLCRSNCR